jgi:hypothetical protein
MLNLFVQQLDTGFKRLIGTDMTVTNVRTNLQYSTPVWLREQKIKKKPKTE